MRSHTRDTMPLTGALRRSGAGGDTASDTYCLSVCADADVLALAPVTTVPPSRSTPAAGCAVLLRARCERLLAAGTIDDDDDDEADGGVAARDAMLQSSRDSTVVLRTDDDKPSRRHITRTPGDMAGESDVGDDGRDHDVTNVGLAIGGGYVQRTHSTKRATPEH
jgi:hypothetical protein